MPRTLSVCGRIRNCDGVAEEETLAPTAGAGAEAGAGAGAEAEAAASDDMVR